MHSSKQQGHMKSPGFTLVEMVVTITVGSVIMLSAVTVVHQAMSVRSRYHSELDQARKLERFLAAWRQQVHRARSFDLTSPTLLSIETTKHTIEYVFTESELKYKKVSHESQQFSREALQLSPDMNCEFSAVSDYALQLSVSKAVPGRSHTRLVTSAIASCRYFEEQASASEESEVSNEE